MDIAIRTDDRGDVMVVEVAGEVDAYTSGSLRDRLTPLVDAGHVRLVVDLRGVTFLDSSGLSVLIGAARQVRRHDGEVHLVVDQERVINLFRAGALTRYFPIHATLEDALAAAASGAGADTSTRTGTDTEPPGGRPEG